LGAKDIIGRCPDSLGQRPNYKSLGFRDWCRYKFGHPWLSQRISSKATVGSIICYLVSGSFRRHIFISLELHYHARIVFISSGPAFPHQGTNAAPNHACCSSSCICDWCSWTGFGMCNIIQSMVPSLGFAGGLNCSHVLMHGFAALFWMLILLPWWCGEDKYMLLMFFVGGCMLVGWGHCQMKSIVTQHVLSSFDQLGGSRQAGHD
jgi:hypothetical protein